MMRRMLLPVVLVVATVIALLPTSRTSSQASASLGSDGAALTGGNYCISCHLADDSRLVAVTTWNGSIGREVVSPCPAATTIHEQLYYTERMLLMIDRASASIGDVPESTRTRLEAYSQLYSRLLDEPVRSLDAFSAEAQTARYRLNKVYAALNQTLEARRQRTVLLYATAATLIVLASLAWGLYNTRLAGRAKPRRAAGFVGRLLFLAAVIVFFALPILRVPAAVATVTTLEQQEAQTVLDTADRAASAADRVQARAWMLARIAAAWQPVDSTRSAAVLAEALSSLDEHGENRLALWGHSLAVQEAMVGVSVDMEKAALVAEQANAQRLWSWGMPLVAGEIGRIDLGRAIAILESAEKAVEQDEGIYRDLELRRIAVAWIAIDPIRSAAAAGSIRDAAIRSWTLREIASLAADPAAFEAAAEAAREIEDPVRRAAALRDTGAASGDASLFEESLAALDGVTGPSRAYALSDLAAVSANAAVVDGIASGYPDARASALLRLGEFDDAWQVAAEIPDPYERARAQAAIAAARGDAAATADIAVPLYRDRALRDVIRMTGDVSLVDGIASPYYRTQAYVALGEHAAAVKASEGLADSYPLIELALAMMKADVGSALDLVGRMTRETDKAGVLAAIAAATGDQALYDQAEGMALAARRTGDPLSSPIALLNLADLFWTVDPANARSALRQAQAATERIAIK